MKIRKNIIKLIALVGLVSLTGCENYLEEDNRSDETADNYFNEDTADELVVATYEALRGAYNNYSTANYGTDIATGSSPFYSTNSLNDYFNMTSDNGGAPWGDNYKVISRANTTINRFNNQISWSESGLSAKANGIAQAQALRALAYYNLVQQYGGVVIYLEEISEIRYDYARSTEEETFTQIIKDLEEAIPVLESYPSEWGRFSKRAAQHLLADVYTTRGYKSFGSATDFSVAADLAEKAIDGYDIRNLTFGQVFDFDNQKNEEVLFSIQFGVEGTSNDTNDKYSLYVWKPYNYVGVARANNPYGEVKGYSAMPTKFFYSLFEDGDDRDEATFHRVLYATEDITYAGNGGEDIIKVGDTLVYYPKHTLSDDELANRLDRYLTYQPGDAYYYDGATDVEGALYQYSANNNRVNYPIFKKFGEDNWDGNGYRDLNVFRVAETHLIAAEANLKAGNTVDALSHLNRVRERATGVANHYTSITIDDILNERAIELAGEENRWAVLKRTGKLLERVENHNPHYQDHGTFDPSVHYVRPIPTNEIELSDGSLEQNPGF